MKYWSKFWIAGYLANTKQNESLKHKWCRLLPRPRPKPLTFVLCFSVVTDGAKEAVLQCMSSSVHRAAVQRRTDALICMLGNGSTPLLPHLAPLQPPVATRRFLLFIFYLFLLNSQGSWVLVHLPAYTYSFPWPSPPTSSCHHQMPRLCLPGKPALSSLAALSHIKQVPPRSPASVSASCPQPSQFQRCFKNQADWDLIFFYFFLFILFYLICFYSHVSGNATTQQDVWIFFYSRRSIFLSSNATILPTLKQNSGPEQETSSCPLLQMSPGLTSTRLCSGSSLPFSSKTISTASTAAHPTSPSVPSHHCDCMLLWKPFRQIFFSLIVNVVC